MFTEAGDVLILQTPTGLANLPGGGIKQGELPRDALIREIGEELGDGFEVMIGQEPYCGVWGAITRGRTALWEVFAGTVAVRADKIPGAAGQINPENNHFDIIKPDAIHVLDQTAGKLAAKAISAVCQIQTREQSPRIELDVARNNHFWDIFEIIDKKF